MGVLLKSQYQLKNANKDDRLARPSTPSTPYIGPYIRTIYGSNYMGDSIKNKGVQLVELKEENFEKESTDDKSPYKYLNPESNKETELRSPVNSQPQFTKSEVKEGNFFRYFFLDNRTKTFIETNKKEYQNSALIDTNIFVPYSFVWYFNRLGMNIKTVKRLKKLGSISINAYEFRGITNITE